MYCVSTFYKEKNWFIEPLCKDLYDLQQQNKGAKYIQIDYSGENKKFVERAASSDWKRTHKNKFTSRSTQQQNSMVEVQFATIAGRGQAMCNSGN
jgi:hypothetical protein